MYAVAIRAIDIWLYVLITLTVLISIDLRKKKGSSNQEVSNADSQMAAGIVN